MKTIIIILKKNESPESEKIQSLFLDYKVIKILNQINILSKATNNEKFQFSLKPSINLLNQINLIENGYIFKNQEIQSLKGILLAYTESFKEALNIFKNVLSILK